MRPFESRFKDGGAASDDICNAVVPFSPTNVNVDAVSTSRGKR